MVWCADYFPVCPVEGRGCAIATSTIHWKRGARNAPEVCISHCLVQYTVNADTLKRVHSVPWKLVDQLELTVWFRIVSSCQCSGVFPQNIGSAHLLVDLFFNESDQDALHFKLKTLLLLSTSPQYPRMPQLSHTTHRSISSNTGLIAAGRFLLWHGLHHGNTINT